MNAASLAAAAVLAGVAWYALDLRRRPFTRCWWCKGTGRVGGSTSKRFGLCRWCRDKPPRPRRGARLVRPELRRKR